MVKYEKKILKDLYESVNGLYAYSFYTRYKIEPDQTLKFIQKYENKGILKFVSNKLSLTKYGRNIILKKIIIIKSGKGKFNSIPKEFKHTKVEINDPYLPDIKTVSEEILEEQKKVE